MILILVVLGFSALSYFTAGRNPGAQLRGRAGHSGSLVGVYLGSLVFEWLLFAYTFWGDHHYLGARVGDRVRGRWTNAGEFGRDVGIALGIWIVLTGVSGLAHFLHPSGTKVIAQLLPRLLREMLVWALLAVSAGFCEEYVFRGYLQRQLLAATGSVWASIVLQAAVFGFAHGYQGGVLMGVIFIYGVLFGAVAWWRKSLRPGMIGHAWIDFFSGLAGYVEHLHHSI